MVTKEKVENKTDEPRHRNSSQKKKFRSNLSRWLKDLWQRRWPMNMNIITNQLNSSSSSWDDDDDHHHCYQERVVYTRDIVFSLYTQISSHHFIISCKKIVSNDNSSTTPDILILKERYQQKVAREDLSLSLIFLSSL